MHALQLALIAEWGLTEVTTAPAELQAGQPRHSIEIARYLAGLQASCTGRFDPDTCHDILDDTYRLLAEAGYTSWQSIDLAELATVILSSTREWEFIGDGSTIDLVGVQRDYTRKVVGEDNFWASYRGMETADGHSYYCPTVP